MSKKAFKLPYILGTGVTPTDDVVIGGGTGQSGTDPVPCSYNAWLNSVWCGEYDLQEPSGTFDDYGTWWAENGFSMEEWVDCGNNASDWKTEWEP